MLRLITTHEWLDRLDSCSNNSSEPTKAYTQAQLQGLIRGVRAEALAFAGKRGYKLQLQSETKEAELYRAC